MLSNTFTTGALALLTLFSIAAVAKPVVHGPAIPVDHPQEVARRAALDAQRENFRRDVAEHCIDDAVDQPDTTGNLLCLDLGGIPPGKRSEVWANRHNLNKRDMSPTLSPRDAQGRMTCDECLGRNGGTPAVTEEEVIICYITVGNPDTYGNQTSCPGDPAPTMNPDGTDGSTVFEGIMDTYCMVAGTGGLFGWASWAVCFAYTYSQNNDNTLTENQAGAELLCDTFLAGLCTLLSNAPPTSSDKRDELLLD